MANAKKCDRCGKFYDIHESNDYAVGIRFVDELGGPLRMVSDLCPDCMAKLINWLTNPAVKISCPYRIF